MINIPMSELTQEALLGVVDAFILREGTDYGRVSIVELFGRSEVSAAKKQASCSFLFEPEEAVLGEEGHAH